MSERLEIPHRLFFTIERNGSMRAWSPRSMAFRRAPAGGARDLDGIVSAQLEHYRSPDPTRRMNILGVSAYYHDSAACLLRDGEIVAAVQEEAFSRAKHDPRLPMRAARFCLR